jgi:hypothetical protein
MADTPMFAVIWSEEDRKYHVKIQSLTPGTIAHSTDELIAECVCSRMNEAFESAVSEIAYLVDSTHKPEVV